MGRPEPQDHITLYNIHPCVYWNPGCVNTFSVIKLMIKMCFLCVSWGLYADRPVYRRQHTPTVCRCISINKWLPVCSVFHKSLKFKWSCPRVLFQNKSSTSVSPLGLRFLLKSGVRKFKCNYKIGLTPLCIPSNSFSARCTCKTCRARSGVRVNGL